ncbi:uncharacterized protein [Ptychodera flava]|uniref:uncharacterized protein n=1 Tax=Ptychodera flava TaxID=63121 RepID=UPI00396A476C
MSVSDKVSALIVNESWGSACSDGIPAINRLLAKVLSDFEIHNIYSTVVRSNADDEKEAKFFKVQLKYPKPKQRRFEKLLRNDLIPEADFIYLHDHFYPNLKQLASEVKILFAYSLTTAEEARKLKKDVFGDAELYFINVWEPDSITPEMISRDKRELSMRIQELSEMHIGEEPLELLKKPHVLDIGKRAHDYFESEYEGCQSIKLCHAQPKFGHVSKSYVKLNVDMIFKIVTLVQSRKRSCLKVMVKVLERVAHTYKGKLEIVLKIIGDICEKEEDILEEISSSKIEVVPKRCFTRSQLEKELLHSHLVLCNADTHISDPSVSLALSLGVPLLLPESPDFKYMIRNYLAPYGENLMVDMKGEKAFQEMLEKKIDTYEIAVSAAKDISSLISAKRPTNEPCEELYEALKRHIARIPHVGRGTQVSESNRDSIKDNVKYGVMEEDQSTLCTSTDGAGSSENTCVEETEHDEKSGEVISLTLDVHGGTPGNGQDMAEVERRLCDTQEQSEVHGAIGRKLEDVEPGIQVSNAEKGCIRYNVKCKTSKALQGFWRRYQSGELRKIVQETLITPEVLRKVNAIWIRMRVVIDYSEYRQALKRLTSREQIEAGKETLTEAEETVNESKRSAKTSDGDRISVLENLNKELREAKETLKTTSKKQEEEIELLLGKHKKDMTDVSNLKSEKTAFEDFVCDAIGMMTIGCHGSKPGQFKHPSGIAVNQNGDLIIADKSNRRVQVIDWYGKCKRKNVFDKYEGVFRPRDVALSSEGVYIVTDHGEMKVMAVDQNSEKINSFGEDINPYGITLSKDGYVLVNDREHDCVKKYTKDGKKLASFGSSGREKGQFNFPWSVAVNSKHQMLISDQNNHRVQLLSSDGVYLDSLGSKGSGQGQLQCPYGIDVDKNDNVYVCDYGNSRIVQFSAKGEFLQNIGEGQVSPRYVAVYKDAGPLRVAVTDWKQHCIKVFFVKTKLSKE